MARSASEQALVDYILRSIRTRSTNEILDYHSKMDVTLKEMMNNGLSANQINGLPIDFVNKFIQDGNISLEDLEDAGVDEELIRSLNPHFGADPIGVTPPDFPPIDLYPPVIDTPTNSFPEMPAKDAILDEIRNNKALIADVQEALNRRIIDSNDLAYLGYSYDFIERLQQYEPQMAIFPKKFSDLPPLRENSSDIYFLGMPGSGKSTMLAALFAYCNREGVMRNIVDNQFGNKYRNQLVLGMVQGFLPASTDEGFINFIPLDMKYQGQNNFQQLNFLDMAGEKFRRVADEGIQEFSDYKNYLNNGNPKCLIFVVNFFEKNIVESTKPKQYT
jgi:hypothetical protein